jgi:Cu+-exporting ATPase
MAEESENNKSKATGTRRVQIPIGGMQCSFCVTTLKGGLSRLSGVSGVYINLGQGEALVDFAPEYAKESDIEDTIRKLGYTVRDRNKLERFKQEEEELQKSKKTFWNSTYATFAGLIILAIFKLDQFLSIYLIIPSAFLAGLNVFYMGREILAMAVNSLRRKILNQHVLMELAALGAIVGGILGLFLHFPSVPFFLIAAFITTYHLLGAYLSTLTRERSTKAVFKMLSLAPEIATVIRYEREARIPVSEVEVGDLVKVKPGERVPVDCEVIEGTSEVDESMVSGESVPVLKNPGSKLLAGSNNLNGVVIATTTKTSDDSFVSRIAGYIQEARVMKPGLIQLIDRILKYFSPMVIGAALLGFAIWLAIPFVTEGIITLNLAIYAALAALIMGYPCALGMSTPLAMERGQILATESGFIFRSGESFMNLRNADTVVFDKTGTLTEGKMKVTDFSSSIEEDKALALLYTLEYNSNHSLAAAIRNYAEENGIDEVLDISEFSETAGIGVSAKIGRNKYFVGGELSIHGKIVPENIKSLIDAAIKTNLKAIFLSDDGKTIAAVIISDKIRDETKQVVKDLEKMGMEIVMLTGDSWGIAQNVANSIGIENFYAEQTPEAKTAVIRKLQSEGRKVVFIGDGINDAPSLAQANVGISVAGGTDVSKESADIVIFRESIKPVIDVIEIGRLSYNKTKQNLTIAFGTNTVGLSLAVAGVMTPLYAMGAMALSASIVLFNSLIRR